MSEGAGLSFFQKLLGFSGPTAIEGTTVAPASSSKNSDDYGTSTIQRSQKEQDEDNSKNISSLPWLPPILAPTDTTAYTLDLMQTKIVDFILKKWGDSNKEVAEADRQQMMDEIRTGFANLFGSQVIPGAVASNTASDPTKVASEGIVPGVDKSQGTEAAASATRPDQSASLMGGIMLMMVSAVAMIGAPSGVSGVIGIGQPGLAVMNEMINAVILPTGLVAPNMKTDLNQLAALMLIPLFYPAMAKALGDVGTAGGQLNLAFATQQLNQAVLLVTDPKFDLFLKSIISTQMPNVTTEQQQTTILQAAKLMILYAALATYYQAETGWTSGQEIGDMVNGKMTLNNPSDPRMAVIALIQQQFTEMGLTPEAAEKVNQKFASYLGDKNSVEDFVSPSRLFTDMSTDLGPERIKNSAE